MSIVREQLMQVNASFVANNDYSNSSPEGGVDLFFTTIGDPKAAKAVSKMC
jgi:hypothetical protein